MKRHSVLTMSTIIAVGLALLSSSAVSEQRSLKDQLVGTWSAVSTVITRPDGTKIEPFGNNARGVLTITGDGRFVLLNTRSDLPRIAANNRLDVTPEEARTLFRGVYGFFGTYEVNEADKTFKFTVVGSTFPNEVGTSATRVIKSISADELIYTNVAGAGGGTVEARYRREK